MRGAGGFVPGGGGLLAGCCWVDGDGLALVTLAAVPVVAGKGSTVVLLSPPFPVVTLPASGFRLVLAPTADCTRGGWGDWSNRPGAAVAADPGCDSEGLLLSNDDGVAVDSLLLNGVALRLPVPPPPPAFADWCCGRNDWQHPVYSKEISKRTINKRSQLFRESISPPLANNNECTRKYCEADVSFIAFLLSPKSIDVRDMAHASAYISNIIWI